MKKSERVLNLSNQLKNGLRIKKDSYCMERGISKRTFERDIKDIRNAMAEEFEGKELVYDTENDTYYITGTEKETTLMEAEYLVIVTILLGSKALGADEMGGLLNSLEQVSEHTNVPVQELKKSLYQQYEEKLPGNPLMKIISDLIRCLVKKKAIRMEYLEDRKEGEQYRKIEVIPINVLFEDSRFVLKAMEIEEGKETEYRIEQIKNFEVVQ